MASETCENCAFLRTTEVQEYVGDPPVKRRYCHRYPQPIQVSLEHWCGEWKSKDKPKQQQQPKQSNSTAKSSRGRNNGNGSK